MQILNPVPNGVLHTISIFSTCLLNKINPEEYLPDILMRLAMRPDNADVKELLPVQWAREKKGAASIKVDYPKN